MPRQLAYQNSGGFILALRLPRRKPTIQFPEIEGTDGLAATGGNVGLLASEELVNERFHFFYGKALAGFYARLARQAAGQALALI